MYLHWLIISIGDDVIYKLNLFLQNQFYKQKMLSSR